MRCQFILELSNYKHIGIFPEQAENWRFIQEQLKHFEEAKVLNLFAYTSAASIVAAKAGAQVTNIEALKQLNAWSKENAKLNEIDQVKWLVDDATTYVDRAVRRAEIYQGIILDPPAFGYGAKGKRWKIERDLKPLLKGVSKLLDKDRSFLIINTYSPKMPMNDLLGMLNELLPKKMLSKAQILGLECNNTDRLELGNLVRSTSF